MCIVFANMKNWRSDQVLSWRSENLYPPFETYETWDLFQAFFCTFKKQLVRDFVWNFWNFVQLMKLVWSMVLHLQKNTGQRLNCLRNFKKLDKLWNFKLVSRILHPQKNKKKLVRDFVWNFWNFVNLWNLKHFAPQQNNWSEFGLELLKLCETYETLKLWNFLFQAFCTLKKNLSKMLSGTFETLCNSWSFNLVSSMLHLFLKNHS